MIDTPALYAYMVDEILLDEVELEASTDLLLSGLMDSLGVMALVEHLEDSYDIEIPPADVTIEHFRSPGTIVAYLESQLAGAGSVAS